MTTFVLPDLGEGLQEAEIVAWNVKEGDHVEAGQPLLSVETDKAVVEIPSPESGDIKALFAKPGDVVPVGAPLVEFAGPAGGSRGHGIVGEIKEEAPRPMPHTAEGTALKATPAVRALARRLEVDLAQITPTGPGGTITVQDVERAARRPAAPGSQTAPLRGVRRAMAHRMVQSHAQIVPATVTEDADVHAWAATEDVTIRLVRAISAGCMAEPALNVWFDQTGEDLTRHDHIDLGMAVDTPDGLFVPVLRNVTKRDDADLRRGLEAMKAAIRKRSIPPEELRGATITLSNFGMIAGRYAAPVVVAPQVAIVSAGRLRPQVVAVDGKAVVHNILPISVTFDHRVVTGGEAARFLRAVIADLERPSRISA